MSARSVAENFCVKKNYIVRCRAGLVFSRLRGTENFATVDCPESLTCGRVASAREVPDMQCLLWGERFV